MPKTKSEIEYVAVSDHDERGPGGVLNFTEVNDEAAIATFQDWIIAVKIKTKSTLFKRQADGSLVGLITANE